MKNKTNNEYEVLLDLYESHTSEQNKLIKSLVDVMGRVNDLIFIYTEHIKLVKADKSLSAAEKYTQVTLLYRFVYELKSLK